MWILKDEIKRSIVKCCAVTWRYVKGQLLALINLHLKVVRVEHWVRGTPLLFFPYDDTVPRPSGRRGRLSVLSTPKLRFFRGFDLFLIVFTLCTINDKLYLETNSFVIFEETTFNSPVDKNFSHLCFGRTTSYFSERGSHGRLARERRRT